MSLLILVADDESDVEDLFRQQFRHDLRAVAACRTHQRPEKFRSSAEKDFFNTICQKRKLLPPCSRVSFGKFAYAAAAIGQLAEAPMASKAASIVA